MSISVNTALFYHLQRSQNSHFNTTIVSHLDEFEKIVRENPKVLYPAFHTQDVVRKAILGLKYWKRATKKRKLEFADRDRSYKYFPLYLNRYLLMVIFFELGNVTRVVFKFCTILSRLKREHERN
jgi:hypothetical protein